MRSKRLAFSLLSLIVVGSLVASCAQDTPVPPTNTPRPSAPDEPAPTGPTGDITIWTMPNGADPQAAIDAEIAAFEALNPGVNVTAEIVGWGDAFGAIQTAVQGGEGPCITQMGTTWVPTFGTMGGLHTFTAAEVFNCAESEVALEQRSLAKAINYGIAYGMGARKFAQETGVSIKEGENFIKTYFERYPGVRSFLDKAIHTAREKGYAETLEGRRRYLPDLHSRNRAQRSAAERMATNSVLQGTAADIIKRAMVRIDRALEAPDAPRARMILTVHDELVFELAPADLEALSRLVEGHMQGVMQLSVPLSVNMSWGQNWREAH